MFTKKISAVVATVAAAAFGGGMFMPQGQELEGRVKSLEDRVTKLEAVQPASAPAPLAEPKVAAPAGKLVAPVTITSKRYQAANVLEGQIQDGLWYDFTCNFAALKKDTRAIKGVLEFRDLFGAAKFQLNMTISDPVRAGGEYRAEGKGFHYNQFLDSHRWMQGTEPKDMQVVFRVQQVIYADNTREEYK